jgi:preprotein translocase subunit YajC
MDQSSRILVLIVLIVIIILVGMWIFNQKYKTQEERDAHKNQLWIGIIIAIAVVVLLFFLLNRDDEKSERSGKTPIIQANWDNGNGRGALSMDDIKQPLLRPEPMDYHPTKYSLDLNSSGVESYGTEQFGVFEEAGKNWRNWRGRKEAGSAAAKQAEAEARTQAAKEGRQLKPAELREIRANAATEAEKEFKAERREVKEAGRKDVAKREAEARAKIAERKKGAAPAAGAQRDAR